MEFLRGKKSEVSTMIAALSTIAICLYPPIKAHLTIEVQMAIVTIICLIPNIFLGARGNRALKKGDKK